MLGDNISREKLTHEYSQSNGHPLTFMPFPLSFPLLPELAGMRRVPEQTWRQDLLTDYDAWRKTVQFFELVGI